MPSAGRGGAESVFHGCRILLWEDEKVLETESSDGCTTAEVGFMPLNCELKNGASGQPCVGYISPQ